MTTFWWNILTALVVLGALGFGYWYGRKGVARKEMGWGSIADIIGDGYDLNNSTDSIAIAVRDFVVDGTPNPFEEEADTLYEEGR